ncbi:MAG: hypothetical protein K2Y21_11340 [Phycisphaerales bacterium]|nr:hypothetical protein [Phycisphaerales bacterium]
MHPRIMLAIVSLAFAAAAHAADRMPHDPRASGSCRADLTGDGVVDDSDFVQFADAYNTLDCSDPAMAAGCPADLNSDAFVDDADFVLFASAYNELLCPAGEVVLRDSIGPDNTMTNGGRVVPITTSSLNGVTHVAFTLSPSESIALKDIAIVVGSAYSNPDIDWSEYDYQVRIWSSPQARASSPQMGDVLNCQFSFPSNFLSNEHVPPTFGSAVGIPPFNHPTQTRILVFDLLNDMQAGCPPVVLNTGGVYPITIQAIRVPSANSQMGIVTSLESGEADIRYTTSTPSGLPVTNFSATATHSPLTGRVAYRVTGLRQ